jgi:predicted esterase
VFDQASGEMDVDTGFKRSNKLVLEEVIREGLVQKCGYKLREIVLFGFGQGGMVALSAAAELGSEELGGVVSIGGVLPEKAPLPEVGKKNRTPILVCKGNRNSAVKEKHVKRLKDTFEFLEVKQWTKTGDGMPSNREEMMPIMQFFARRLRSTKGVPEGSVEIG